MERHERLRYSKVDNYLKKADTGYALVKQLLKRNQHIALLDRNRKRMTDGEEIHQLSAINCFVRDVQGLTQDPLPLLPTLIGETLIQSASCDFRRTLLLVANHTDTLCEFVQFSPFFFRWKYD
jgi:hypothetical protein